MEVGGYARGCGRNHGGDEADAVGRGGAGTEQLCLINAEVGSGAEADGSETRGGSVSDNKSAAAGGAVDLEVVELSSLTGEWISKANIDFGASTGVDDDLNDLGNHQVSKIDDLEAVTKWQIAFVGNAGELTDQVGSSQDGELMAKLWNETVDRLECNFAVESGSASNGKLIVINRWR